MCESVNVDDFKIEIKLGPFGRILALATIKLGDLQIKGFIISEGEDRNTGEIAAYVQPPMGENKNSWGKRTPYFWIEKRKWELLSVRILEEYTRKISAKVQNMDDLLDSISSKGC